MALAVTAAAAALLAAAPSFARWHWIARLLLREMSLALVAVALAALWLSRGLPHPRAAVLVRVLSLFALTVGVVQFALPYRLFREVSGARFSLRDYVTAWAGTPVVAIERDVIVDAAAPDLRADIYRPAVAANGRPLVVSVHGGSWRGGDKSQVPHFSRWLAASGYTVVEVSYRFAPAAPFPAAVADVKCLVSRLRERASALRLDATKVVLLGRSAGGQIALLAAYSAGDARIGASCAVTDVRVDGVIAFYAPADLVWGHENPMRPDIASGTESLELYLGGPPAKARATYELASPMSWTDRPLPPTLLIHGDGDPIVGLEHSRRLHKALGAGGHSSRLLAIPFAEHGFDARPGGVGEQLARHAVLAFLERVGPRP